MRSLPAPVWTVINLLLLLQLPLNGLSAQPFLRGAVVDGETNTPVPFATVYVDGTTIGTTTDEAGVFNLPLARLRLPATVVVTHINYRSVRQSVGGTGDRLEFVLFPSPTVAPMVEVADRNNREKNLTEFRERYLGTGDWGRQASISNPEALLFNRKFKERQTGGADSTADRTELTFDHPLNLEAYSLSPLEVDLPDLGYRIKVDLIRFVADYPTGNTLIVASYYYRPYEEQGPPGAIHAKNRRLAYYNSQQHFFRALYHGRLEEEGYAVFEDRESGMVPISLYEYLRPAAEPEQKVFSGLEERVITIEYYGNRRGEPVPPGRRFLVSPVTSRLHLSRSPFVFRKNGTMPDKPPSFSGALGDVTISRLLPADYVPD